MPTCAPLDGPPLYAGLLQVCACLEDLLITTFDPLAHLRSPLAFEGLNPIKTVRHLWIEGFPVNPSRICAVFPNINAVYLDSAPETYSVQTLQQLVGWGGLKSLILTVPCHEQVDALFVCEYLPSLEYLNMDSKRIVARLVDVFDSGEFICPVDVQTVRLPRASSFALN